MIRREKTRYGKRAIPWEGHWRTWYRLHRWQKLRRAQLRKEPLCAMCFAKGKIVPATVADHVVPHRGDWTQFWMGELQSLCAACHNGDK
jgi:5-methylcytosine-specific restriction endonuclease McrA